MKNHPYHNINVGLDIFEIIRLRKKPMSENYTLYQKIFFDEELDYCLKYSDPYPHLAGIFAAKEAIIKCLEGKISMKNIQILRKNKKIPYVKIHSPSGHKFSISISHSQDFALAMAGMLL